MSYVSMTMLPKAVAKEFNDSGSVVHADFDGARRRAIWLHLKAVMTGKPDDLLWLARARESAGLLNESYGGVKTIDVNRIVGSESRATDFNRDFLPRQRHLDARWSRVNSAFHDRVDLPAIRVFELEGEYFVRDGNHRVSVAKYHGVKCIDAEVVRLAACG